jgi:hypothetical protein
MTPSQIDTLRDFAIDHLPRAKAEWEQAIRYGSSPTDYYNLLAATAMMVRSKPTTTAIEYSAANVLESVAILYADREQALSKPERSLLLARLATDAKELSMLTGRTFPWLDLMPSTPQPEPDEEPAPATQKPAPSIAGRFLTTAQAAEALGHKVQTLRGWSSKQNGPIRPRKVGSRLLWSGDEILALMKHK